MMDITCLVALALFVLSDVFELISSSKSFFKTDEGSAYEWEDMGDLNPNMLQKHFAFDGKNIGFTAWTRILSALATFAFFIPILQVSWILSDGGKKRIATQILVFLLALGGGVCELIVTLMLLGIESTITWVGSSDFFNLEDWISSASGDKIGYRVLQIVSIVVEGMTLWINAFEWISIFCIMFILFFTVRANHKKNRQGKDKFGMKWAFLGLAIGIVGLLEFISELLRLESWQTYMFVSYYVRSLNTFILVPAYLFILSKQLQNMREKWEIKQFKTFTAAEVGMDIPDDGPHGENPNAGMEMRNIS